MLIFLIDRTEAVGCSSDEEFLAKLYCVRDAFEVPFVWFSACPFTDFCDFQLTLSDSQKRKTMADAGRRMIGGLLKQARKVLFHILPFL